MPPSLVILTLASNLRQLLDTVHRFDVLNTMLPWPVRPPANVARYSVCGEPSRQCYTPPMPIQKAFISRDPTSGSFTNDDRPSRQDGSDVHLRSQFPDPSCGGPKISCITECLHSLGVHHGGQNIWHR